MYVKYSSCYPHSLPNCANQEVEVLFDRTNGRSIDTIAGSEIKSSAIWLTKSGRPEELQLSLCLPGTPGPLRILANVALQVENINDSVSEGGCGFTQ